jgi:hypothetical protein
MIEAQNCRCYVKTAGTTQILDGTVGNLIKDCLENLKWTPQCWVAMVG